MTGPGGENLLTVARRQGRAFARIIALNRLGHTQLRAFPIIPSPLRERVRVRVKSFNCVTPNRDSL